MTSASAQTLATSLDKLAIHPEAPKILQTPTTATSALSESWEDDAAAVAATSSDAEQQQQPTAAHTTINTIATSTRHIPSPPPPTPASPTTKTKATAFDSPYQTLPPYGMNGSVDDARSSGNRSASGSGRSTPQASAEQPEKRPEKTTSTAARLIAAGLGQRAPRRTEEERKYDQAMKVQEKKRRDAAKAEEERKKAELEQAKKSIWED